MLFLQVIDCFASSCTAAGVRKTGPENSNVLLISYTWFNKHTESGVGWFRQGWQLTFVNILMANKFPFLKMSQGR